MNPKPPIGPLIPSSENFNTHYSRLLGSERISATRIELPYEGTLGEMVITSGHIYNLLDPIENSDGINKRYADLHAPGGIPGNPVGSLQFNDGVTYAGSDGLIYQVIGTSQTLYASAINISSNYVEAKVQNILYVSNIAGLSNITIEYVNTQPSTISSTVSTRANPSGSNFYFNDIKLFLNSGLFTATQIFEYVTDNETVSQYINVTVQGGGATPQTSPYPQTILETSAGLVMSNGTISGITVPNTPFSAVNKEYVDLIFRDSQFNIGASVGSLTYSSSNMINSIIYRDLGTSSSDTTASAYDIYLANLSTSIIIPSFSVVNMATDPNKILSLYPGPGVSIIGSIDKATTDPLIIYPGYQMSSQLIFSDTVSSLLNLTVTGLSFNRASSNFVLNDLHVNSNITKVNDQFTFDTTSVVLNLQYIKYAPSNFYPIIYRDFEGPKEDTFEPVSEFINGFFDIYSRIDYIYSTGAIEFVIKNISSGTDSSLQLVESTGWTLDPNSNNKIGPGQTGYFYMYINTETQQGQIYTIGIMDTI
jgi:hypothetical protein